VEVLDLSKNFFTNTIPSELGQLTNLRSVFLQSNRLTGGVEDSLNPSVQRRLKVVDMSDNLLTGHLSENVFQLPALRVLALSGESPIMSFFSHNEGSY
jgi:somatic embryogenesis receptor kinase 1